MFCVNMFLGVQILIYDNVLLLKRFLNFENGVHYNAHHWRFSVKNDILCLLKGLQQWCSVTK